jgi:hypothetical protein
MKNPRVRAKKPVPVLKQIMELHMEVTKCTGSAVDESIPTIEAK